MGLRDRHSTAEVEQWSDEDVLYRSVEYPAAFGIIVDRYQRAFLLKTEWITGSRDEAEDIVQDTFLKIYKNAARFEVREGARFSSWAYRILLNTCYTFCAKRKRERNFFDRIDEESFNELRAGDKEWEAYLDRDAFISVVAKIPQAFKALLSLVIVEGKTSEDIARLEGISVGAARVRLHRARQEFKKAITDSKL